MSLVLNVDTINYQICYLKWPKIYHRLISRNTPYIGWPSTSHYLAETVGINNDRNHMYLWTFGEQIFVHVSEKLLLNPLKSVDIYYLQNMNFLCPVYCFAHCNAQTTTEPEYCPQKAAMRHDSPDFRSIMTLTVLN